jgi:DNA recombination protein RmuC
MDLMSVLVFCAGALVGAAVIWLGRRRARVALQALLQAEVNAERTRADSLGAENVGLRQEIEAWRARHQEAESARAAAESRADRIPELESQIRSLQDKLSAARVRVAELETQIASERSAAEEKIQTLTQIREEMLKDFERLAGQALKSNEKSFLTLAEQAFEKHKAEAKVDLERRQEAITALVKPIDEALRSYKQSLDDIEKQRVGAYNALSEQVRQLMDAQNAIRLETGRLVQALRAPKTRGRWGEYTLRRVLEMAGMSENVDFVEQSSVVTESGRLQPDVIIRLPGGKCVVVDAKTPLEAYLAAVEADDESERQARLADHARQVRTHLKQLGSKQYWQALEHTPDFVVMFIPGESFLCAAVERHPSLIDEGVDHRVLLATPTILIALVKTIAYGWQQERLAENARKVSNLGRELYERIGTMGEHIMDLGKSLGQAVDRYNKAVGSLETRVLPSARRFQDLHVVPAGSVIPEIETVEKQPRAPQAEELRRLPGASQVLPAGS